MSFTRETARLGVWVALLVGLGAAAVPLATGHWDPAWLRVAGRPVLHVSGGSAVEVPDVPARFTAHGPAGQGITWSLSGERVVAVDPPRVHAFVSPTLVLRRGHEVVAELSAARGEVRLSEGEQADEPGRAADDEGTIQVLLEGGVQVVHGDVTATTEQVSIWVDPDRLTDPAGAARLTAPGPVDVRLGVTGRRLTAAGMEARLAPLRVDLVGPVDLEDPGDLASGTGARTLRGRAAHATLEGTPAGARLDPQAATAPGRLDLRLEQADLRTTSGDALTCDVLRLSLVREGAGARAALGGQAGVSPAPALAAGPASYAVDRVTATGRVRLRAVRDLATPDAAVTLLADEVTADGFARRVTARGRPARVEDARDGWLEAPTLSLATVAAVGTGRALQVEAASDGPTAAVRFGVVERQALDPDATTPTEPPGRAWRGAARRLSARLKLDAAPAASGAGSVSGVNSASAALARVERLELDGAEHAPLVLERDDGATRLEARAVVWDALGPEAQLTVEGAPATVLVGAELTREAPWRVRARSVRARLERGALAALDDEAAPADVAVLASAVPFRALSSVVVTGDVDVRREGTDSPSRHVALRGDRLTWSRAEQRVELAGAPAAPAEVTIGEGTLRAPALDLDVVTGEARATGPCALEWPDARGPIAVHAAQAEGRIDPRPASWREATDARRAARRAGARFVLPGWLLALELRGDAAGRVRATGPGGLSAAADRATWDAAEGVARLEADPAGPPVQLALEAGTLTAPRVLVRPAPGPGRAHARIEAEGGVRVEGALPDASGPGERLALTCGWLSAEVWEPWRADGPPPEGSPSRSSLGAVVAGGDEGVAVDGAVAGGAAGQVPVRLRAARLEGDGVTETLRLTGAPGRPVVVARGDLALEAPGARLGFEQAGQALRLALDAPWTCRLPPVDGQAGGTASGAGPLALLLDAPTQGAPASTRDPVELARRLLALDVTGGVDVVTPSLRARADRVTLARPGELVLRGDPVEVTRGGMRSRGLEQVLRLEELTGRAR